MSTSQPMRRKNAPANRPAIEPPITTARRLRPLVGAFTDMAERVTPRGNGRPARDYADRLRDLNVHEKGAVASRCNQSEVECPLRVLCHEYRRSKRRYVTVREMKEGPSGSAIRSLIPSHRKLLWPKAMVVSVAETSGRDPGRQGRERRAQANCF